MAKYTILMSCGHESTVDLGGKTSDREHTIEYLKLHGLCRKCYKEKIDAENKAKGLIFNATVLPYINVDDGGILLSVWFSGDTLPHKDDIKALDYHWGEREAANDLFATYVPKCWQKTISLDNLEEEVEKAISVGAKSLVSDKGLFATMNYHIALEKQEKWKEQQERIKAINRPKVPSLISGHRWNRKIYGKAGNWSVYLDGEKVLVTDEQAEELKIYAKEKEEYNKKVEIIKNERI